MKIRGNKAISIALVVFCLMIGWLVIWQESGISFDLRKVYAVSDTFASTSIWNAPNGIYSVSVECWGGGGSGGGLTTNRTVCRGGGGAGGQYVSKSSISITPGTGYSVTIGTGGTGTTGSGVSGGDSIFGSNAVVAKGGLGGQSYESGFQAGIGSTGGAIGDLYYRGGNGSAGGTGTTGVLAAVVLDRGVLEVMPLVILQVLELPLGVGMGVPALRLLSVVIPEILMGVVVVVVLPLSLTKPQILPVAMVEMVHVWSPIPILGHHLLARRHI